MKGKISLSRLYDLLQNCDDCKPEAERHDDHYSCHLKMILGVGDTFDFRSSVPNGLMAHQTEKSGDETSYYVRVWLVPGSQFISFYGNSLTKSHHVINLCTKPVKGFLGLCKREMEGKSDSVGGIDKGTSDPEKVLIERDGKFELVDASDMQAVETTSLQAVDASDMQAMETTSLQAVGSNETKAVGSEPQATVESKQDVTPELVVQPQGEGEPKNTNSMTINDGGEALQSPLDPDKQPTAATARPATDSPAAATELDLQPTAVHATELNQQQTAESDSPVIDLDQLQPTTGTDRPSTQLQPTATTAHPAIDSPSNDLDQQPTAASTDNHPTDTHNITQEATAQKDPPHSSGLPSSGSKELKSGSRVQIVENIHHKGPQGMKYDKGLTSGSVISLKQVDRRNQVSRARSAPGLRVTTTEDEIEKEKRKRSEAAFAGWLVRKNKDLAEKQKFDKEKHKSSEDEVKQRRHQNEVAFQAWLTAKDRELQEQRTKGTMSRPTTSMPYESSVAYENWLSRKKEQKRMEVELQQKRLQETKEAAKKVDPTIVDKAYKRYVLFRFSCCGGNVPHFSTTGRRSLGMTLIHL